MSRGSPTANLRPHGHDAKRTSFYDGVGRCVRELRMAAGLSQAELGKLVSLNQAQIGAIETNRTLCSLYLAANIAEALDVTLEDIARVTVGELA